MEIKEQVKEKYGEAALRVRTGGSSCCGSAPSASCCADPITSNLYDSAQTSQIPEEAGAVDEQEYAAKLAAAGFEHISIEPARGYSIEDARRFLSGEGIDVDAIAPQMEGKFLSAFIRAAKPIELPSRDR